MNRCISLIVAIASAGTSLADEAMTKAQCLDDISEAFEIIEDVHPNPYAVNSKRAVEKLRSQVAESLPDTVDRRQLFLHLAPIVASLQDGHTSLRIPLQSSRAAVRAGAFPLDVAFEGTTLRVVDDWSDRSLPRGATIHQINGCAVEDIVSRLWPLQHAELAAGKRLNIAKYFQEYLWVKFRMVPPYRLTYSECGSEKTIDVEILGGSLAEITRRRNAEQRNFRPYSYRHLPEANVGVLSYNLCQPGPRFDHFLQETFRRIQADNVRALVVDVRKNGGGSARANIALFHYVTGQRYRMYSGGDIKISNRIKSKVGRERFEDRFGPWDSRGGSLLSERDSDWFRPGQNELRYRGPLYVLSGTQTQSSAMNFVCAVKDCQLGLVVGEETGDPATAFGDLEPFRLPNSGLELFVSTKYFIRPNKSEVRRGVLPDISVQSLAPTCTERDVALEAVKALVEGL